MVLSRRVVVSGAEFVVPRVRGEGVGGPPCGALLWCRGAFPGVLWVVLAAPVEGALLRGLVLWGRYRQAGVVEIKRGVCAHAVGLWGTRGG